MIKKATSIMIISALILLTGCQNEKEEKKKKYDSLINEIIILENKRLQSKGILDENEILKREDTGIIVFKEGKFIELIYDLKGHKKFQSLYKKDIKGFEKLEKEDIEQGKADKGTEEEEYVENYILKK
ncbi:TPA: hypothetical protein N1S95_004550 [Salmonella enterica subsp. enterica serovar Typhi]|nr:hypothetical protein [Salmonella enterica subsp. enterica serovar Typhi]